MSSVLRMVYLFTCLLAAGCVTTDKDAASSASDPAVSRYEVMGESVDVPATVYEPSLSGRRMSTAEKTHWRECMDAVEKRLAYAMKNSEEDIGEFYALKKRINNTFTMALRYYSDVDDDLAERIQNVSLQIDHEILRLKNPEPVEIRTAKRLPVVYRRESPNGFMFRWPLSEIDITSPFGSRIDPINGNEAFHDGIDLGGDPGDLVVAPERGIVIATGYRGRCGNLVAIDHGNGFQSFFCHLQDILTVPGARVKRGWPIGLLGNTGRTTGPHLHFKLSLDGKAVDPTQFIGKTLPEPGSHVNVNIKNDW